MPGHTTSPGKIALHVVELWDGTYLDAEIVGVDPPTDLAVLKIDPPARGLTIVQFGDSDQVRVGQLALAIGSPFGLERTLTVGYISALNRTICSNDKYFTHICSGNPSSILWMISNT